MSGEQLYHKALRRLAILGIVAFAGFLVVLWSWVNPQPVELSVLHTPEGAVTINSRGVPEGGVGPFVDQDFPGLLEPPEDPGGVKDDADGVILELPGDPKPGGGDLGVADADGAVGTLGETAGDLCGHVVPPVGLVDWRKGPLGIFETIYLSFLGVSAGCMVGLTVSLLVAMWMRYREERAEDEAEEDEAHGE